MSFSTSRIIENDLSLVRLQDNATGTIISVLPQFGALLHEFAIPMGGKLFNVIDNYKDKLEIENYLGLSFKSSKLSPFPCRIPEGKYALEGETFQLNKNFFDGSAIHGLLYNKSFNILNTYADDEKASVALKYHYKREDPGYPFEYVCDVRYTLHPGARLLVETTLLNLDDVEIPLADGWHPYFTLGNSVDDYELQFSSGHMLEFNERLIPTGKYITDTSFATPTQLGQTKLDNCFLLQLQEGMPCCILRNPLNKLALAFFTDTGYSYLQIFTPDHRKSIAIENLSGAPDCFNNGMGLMLLPPRRSETFHIWYQLSVGKID
jgi:aldose 1-epimerase